jgi:adsorption protein A
MKKTNLLLLLLMNAGMLTHVAAEETDVPLSGPAYEMADAAYKSYAKGDYAKAAEQAREAVRLRPDIARLKQLLVQAEASQKSKQQAAVAAKAPAKAAPASNPAYTAADKAYKAYDKKDYAAAISNAQHAVRLAPSNAAYRTLLINAQLAAQRFDDADKSVDEALQRFGTNSSFARQREIVNQNLAGAAGAQIYQALDQQDYAKAVDAACSEVCTGTSCLSFVTGAGAIGCGSTR